MTDRRAILEEAAAVADFYAEEMEQLLIDALLPPLETIASLRARARVLDAELDASLRHATPSYYLARAKVAHAIAAEIRELITHPKPHITERAGAGTSRP